MASARAHFNEEIGLNFHQFLANAQHLTMGTFFSYHGNMFRRFLTYNKVLPRHGSRNETISGLGPWSIVSSVVSGTMSSSKQKDIERK